MIIQDLTPIWITTCRTEPADGVMQDFYTDLRTESVNLQLMSNEVERKTYGEITNSAIVIRTDTLPDIHKNDHIYLQTPASTGQVNVGGVTYDNYPPGDYAVESVKPSYLGGKRIKNPTVITARAVTK